MQRFAFVLFLAATPALATSVVYKYEGADGVVTLTDKPLKNEEHPTIIRLDSAEFTKNQAAISTKKIAAPTVAEVTTPPPAATPLDRQTLQAKITQAKLNIEKAENTLTRARIAQLKARRECETLNYRTSNNGAECKAINSTNEEIQLSRARATLSQLEEQQVG